MTIRRILTTSALLVGTLAPLAPVASAQIGAGKGALIGGGAGAGIGALAGGGKGALIGGAIGAGGGAIVGNENAKRRHRRERERAYARRHHRRNY